MTRQALTRGHGALPDGELDEIVALLAADTGRGFHSSIFRLHLSTFAGLLWVA